jgi:hypothetical protein
MAGRPQWRHHLPLLILATTGLCVLRSEAVRRDLKSDPHSPATNVFVPVTLMVCVPRRAA